MLLSLLLLLLDDGVRYKGDERTINLPQTGVVYQFLGRTKDHHAPPSSKAHCKCKMLPFSSGVKPAELCKCAMTLSQLYTVETDLDVDYGIEFTISLMNPSIMKVYV